MVRPPALAQTALAERVTRPVWFAILGFANGEMRVTTLPNNITVVSSDAEINGKVFMSLNAKVLDFGTVHNQEGGSETLNVVLSGQLLPNQDILTTIGNTANWQGRSAKFWQGVLDENGVFTGDIWLYHQGWMSSVSIAGSGEQQLVNLAVEGYLAMYGRAAMRTYMDQTRIDANDLSPQLITLAGLPGTGSGGGNIGGVGNGGGLGQGPGGPSNLVNKA